MSAASKVMTAEEAVRTFVHDGYRLALGGFSTNRRAYGLVREIIRQGKRGLYVQSGPAGGDVDMLIGAGCVEVLDISYIANSGFSMVCRRFRDAVEGGRLLVEDWSLDVQTIIYHGAALGLPYVAVKDMLGSDLERKWGISEDERRARPKLSPKKFVVQEDPFEPGSLLCLVPTPKIDVACIHVQVASPSGICRIEGSAFQDEDIAVAARHTLVSCEELVPDEEMLRCPAANTLPGLCVSAVVEMPFGAHPSQCHGRYDYDPAAFIEYDEASRTDEAFRAYIDEHVLPDHGQYVARVGRERLEALAVDPVLGYVPGLERR